MSENPRTISLRNSVGKFDGKLEKTGKNWMQLKESQENIVFRSYVLSFMIFKSLFLPFNSIALAFKSLTLSFKNLVLQCLLSLPCKVLSCRLKAFGLWLKKSTLGLEYKTFEKTLDRKCCSHS